MRSELFRIPIELGGVPLLGFGVLLALWLVSFSVVLARHAKQHGVDADFWGYAQPAAVGALILAFVPRFAPEGVPIRGYGVMLLVAISVGVAMAVHRARRHSIAPDTILSLVFWLFVAGILGARAFFVIEYWEERFAGQPLATTVIDVLKFTEGGLVVYGSVIGGLIAFLVFVRRHGLPMRGLADILAPCFLVGLAIGRIGCLLNGCCYGGPCELPWAITFPVESPPFMDQLVSGELHGAELIARPVDPNEESVFVHGPTGERVAAIDGVRANSPTAVAEVFASAYSRDHGVTLRLEDGSRIKVPAADRTRSLPVHPTQIYSTINAALTAWLLWSWFPHRRRDGEVALLMFTLYPVSRFLLEMIRTDEASIFGTGLSISQNVSLIVLFLAVAGWVWLLRTPPGRQLQEVPPSPPQMPRTAAASVA